MKFTLPILVIYIVILPGLEQANCILCRELRFPKRISGVSENNIITWKKKETDASIE